MVKFAYNNVKNVKIDYILFELNCNYYPHNSFENDVDPCLKFFLANKPANKLKDLILIYQQNLHNV